ncbi:MAG: hypothetical protein HS130_07775 [Deltaproteobacteria bacterium]|nr:hypothetical protein [Deltaproteobacteria bacterium]MCL4873091.1 hypothetical protein [bacterium]
MFTLFQQGFASGFFAGAALVLVGLLAWERIATALARRRNRRLPDATRFRRASYIALSQHNDDSRLERIFGK